VYKIDEDACIACGSCAGSCSQDAIVENGNAYKITDACIDCGACSDTCPVSAISAE